jgi:6-phosphogluconolactonase
MTSVLVFNDLSTLSQYAASQFDLLAEQAVAQRGRFLTALSGGSTPEGLYRLLAQPPYAGKAWWRQTHLFWGDERCVLPDDPESCYGQVKRLLLSSINIPETQVHRVPGELQPGEAAAAYRLELARAADAGLDYPRFDLVLLGMGTDGHTASLFPGSAPITTEPALAVSAQYQDRPARRVTLSPSVFNAARQVFFMAVGGNKADTLVKVLTGPADDLNLPAQRIRPTSGLVTWLVDEAAAQKIPETLKVRTFP